MDWEILVAAAFAFFVFYGIAHWLMRSTMCRILWFTAVCALVMTSIYHLRPPAISLIGMAGSFGTMLRVARLQQEKKKTAL